ncbi:hypothetical protein NECHADRAFT_87592 [Paecilomyces variotii No. 5]|uniref:Uncharacterized protein n=1 Tax=Byssochlamys spectabilis (strain No. 5 / NBRC 109023) TaxID=1356009 RepID=V5HRC9_BYSSN|nr:hypothetical protein NECHADRAFT_87592 [Paecilomyces variotii No. 5]
MTEPSTTIDRHDQDEHFRQEVLETFNAGFRDISTAVDKVDLLVSIKSFSLHFPKDVSRRASSESEETQQQLCVLWSMFMETAKVLDEDDPFEEKLFSLLLWTKEFDSLHRSIHYTETVASAWDLYPFGARLQAMWEELLRNGTVPEQCNLASFSAKALSIGLCREEISLTALWYLREALETNNEARTMALLPVVRVWFDYCRHTLLTFSFENQYYDDKSKTHLVAPGNLAQSANISQQGFSLKRWLFWRERLKRLSNSTCTTAAYEAKKSFINMVNCGRELDYDVPDEAIFAEKLHGAMAEALSKSGKVHPR